MKIRDVIPPNPLDMSTNGTAYRRVLDISEMEAGQSQRELLNALMTEEDPTWEDGIGVPKIGEPLFSGSGGINENFMVDSVQVVPFGNSKTSFRAFVTYRELNNPIINIRGTGEVEASAIDINGSPNIVYYTTKPDNDGRVDVLDAATESKIVEVPIVRDGILLTYDTWLPYNKKPSPETFPSKYLFRLNKDKWSDGEKGEWLCREFAVEKRMVLGVTTAYHITAAFHYKVLRYSKYEKEERLPYHNPIGLFRDSQSRLAPPGMNITIDSIKKAMENSRVPNVFRPVNGIIAPPVYLYSDFNELDFFPQIKMVDVE